MHSIALHPNKTLFGLKVNRARLLWSDSAMINRGLLGIELALDGEFNGLSPSIEALHQCIMGHGFTSTHSG